MSTATAAPPVTPPVTPATPEVEKVYVEVIEKKKRGFWGSIGHGLKRFFKAIGRGIKKAAKAVWKAICWTGKKGWQGLCWTGRKIKAGASWVSRLRIRVNKTKAQQAEQLRQLETWGESYYVRRVNEELFGSNPTRPSTATGDPRTFEIYEHVAVTEARKEAAEAQERLAEAEKRKAEGDAARAALRAQTPPKEGPTPSQNPRRPRRPQQTAVQSPPSM